MKTIKILLFMFLMMAQTSIYAQFISAEIGVDGLTCSACTRSVEMSIRKLDFVDSVTMNLEHTEGKIIFKKGAKVEIEKIANAVIDAGFSLRSLYAVVNVDQLKVANDLCWMYENNTYHFVKIPESKDVNGPVTLKFIGDKFMSKKEFKSWKSLCTNPCKSTAQLSKEYYVTFR